MLWALRECELPSSRVEKQSHTVVLRNTLAIYFCHLFSECILPKEMVPCDTLKNLAGLSIKKLMRPAN